MSQKKRKSLNIKEKLHVISKLESGTLNKDLAKEYGVPHSTISSIWSKREKIKILYDANYLKMKRARTTKNTNIEEALLKWYKHQRANNYSVNGPILQQKANDFAKHFGEDFVCSASWIQRFKARHSIIYGKICGENKAPSPIDEWKSQKLPILCAGYEPDNIFNADETGLFYSLTPDSSFKFEGQHCSLGEMSNMRLTILVAANMTGTMKKKLLVVGKPKKPSCLKNNNSLLVTYENNVNSWMTSQIFERWLRHWDAELEEIDRKILLLVDKCPAHESVNDLRYIKLVFLPLNVTSVLQPMQQGIIRCLKYKYRRFQVLNIIRNLDNDNHKSFSVLDAILMISEAWENVSQNTIADCFRQAGITEFLTIYSDDDVMPLVQQIFVTDSDEEEVPLDKLAQSLRPPLNVTETEKFVDIDNSVATCLSAAKNDVQEIVAVKEEIDDRNTEEQFCIPSLNDGLNAINVLRKILLCKEQFKIQGNYDDTLVNIKREIENSYVQEECAKD
ncbi:PREDICTED: tigger transposable element-derived protein 6-like [Papilio xuthus]|uniref:Tigger transposable element-derived protein 6-like n=1 Tax=Papilio xuthus TaxID=66420 RepID=A0AAJ6ZS01_PAPXU|nr:PREDICTED: tigger transposable element-derived protein 6-like [Papilio xuthus]